MGGNCQEFLFVEKSLEKLFSNSTLFPFWLAQHPENTVQENRWVCPPKALLLRVRESLELDVHLPCCHLVQTEWCPMNEAPAACQNFQDTNPDITRHTHRAGLSGAVSSFPRAERGGLFVCFLSQDDCFRPDLVEASWLSMRWCHSALPAAAVAWGVTPSPTKSPERSSCWEPACVGFTMETSLYLGRQEKSGVQHSKWVNRWPEWSRTHVSPKYIHISSLTLWGVVHIRPSPKSLLGPSGLHDLLSCS